MQHIQTNWLGVVFDNQESRNYLVLARKRSDREKLVSSVQRRFSPRSRHGSNVDSQLASTSVTGSVSHSDESTDVLLSPPVASPINLFSAAFAGCFHVNR
jgi:hypothetical protein